MTASSSTRILIFPSGMPHSISFFYKCKQQGREIIGASSLLNDPSRKLYSSWSLLPYIVDPLFDEALKKLVIQFNIGEIYTPNIVVWNYLKINLPHLIPGVTLANISPIDEALSGYRKSLEAANAFIENQLHISHSSNIKAMPSYIELAGLCRYADLVPGMCSNEKLNGLLEIARYSVEGDIVEIGSWWGKSAFILAWLARHFKIGNLLCVDPWCNLNLAQNELIVDSGSEMVDASEAFDIFQIGLLPFNFNHINYIRKTSSEGALEYSSKNKVSSELFGETQYSGHISILHIDGNHTYEAVKLDVNSWVPFMAKGGWIIFDDYLWPYGGGPKKAGDQFIHDNFYKISTSFIVGGALFIKLE